MSQVALVGPDLEGFSVDQPAASVRLLIPSPGSRDLVIPTWNGNEFLLADGTRPTIRTFTPLRADSEAGELELEIVLHNGGATSDWVRRAAVGDPAAISGPGRGYGIDHAAPAFLVAGDESAIPAISQLLESLPVQTPASVIIEVAQPDARLTLPYHPLAAVEWCDLTPGAPPGDALVDAVQGADLDEGIRVWAAGEAAAMHQIRRHLFEDRGLPRAHVTVRGYWKRERNSVD
jgi:NADPH-dependent ferric siderophore reductase